MERQARGDLLEGDGGFHKSYARRGKQQVFLDRRHSSDFVCGWMVPLLLSSRDLEFGSIIRILCVATILTLGIDPILGTLPKGMPRPLSDRWSSHGGHSLGT